MKQKAFKIEKDELCQNFQNLKNILINSFSNQLLYSLPQTKPLQNRTGVNKKNAHFL